MLPNCMSHMNHMECIFLGCVTHLVHDLVPVLAGEDLEDGEHGDGEGVEVGGRDAVGEAEGAAEELRGSHNCNYMVTIVITWSQLSHVVPPACRGGRRSG